MRGLSLFTFILLTIYSGHLSASTTDYYDRILLYTGVEKGVRYNSDSTPLYLKSGIGYGIDDDKVFNLNLMLTPDTKSVYVNPEFMLLFNEFSRLKFPVTVGIDLKVRGDFDISIRTMEGLIVDIVDYFSVMFCMDTRFNLYHTFYVESMALFSLIIRL